MSDSLQPHGLQHARLLCPSPSPRVFKFMSIESVMPSNHLILCHPFLLLPSIFPTPGSFPTSWLFPSCGQSIGASASASVLPMNIWGWFPLGLTGLISFCPRGSQESSRAPQFKSNNFLALNLLYGPPLTSVHDRRNINNLRYTDDTTLMAKSKEELKIGAIWWLLMVLDTVQPFICSVSHDHSFGSNIT